MVAPPLGRLLPVMCPDGDGLSIILRSRPEKRRAADGHHDDKDLKGLRQSLMGVRKKGWRHPRSLLNPESGRGGKSAWGDGVQGPQGGWGSSGGKGGSEVGASGALAQCCHTPGPTEWGGGAASRRPCLS